MLAPHHAVAVGHQRLRFGDAGRRALLVRAIDDRRLRERRRYPVLEFGRRRDELRKGWCGDKQASASQENAE